MMEEESQDIGRTEQQPATTSKANSRRDSTVKSQQQNLRKTKPQPEEWEDDDKQQHE